MENLPEYVVAIFFAAILLFGFLASRHVDESKIGSLKRRSIMLMGPMVPEEALTATGKRWAFLRNLMAAVLFGGAVLCGILMRIFGE